MRDTEDDNVVKRTGMWQVWKLWCESTSGFDETTHIWSSITFWVRQQVLGSKQKPVYDVPHAASFKLVSIAEQQSGWTEVFSLFKQMAGWKV
ncbi:MAG: hypothetical protein ACKERG_03500 [Candidatus Hodgkinia cicadicola]